MFALDERFGQIVASTTEPLIGMMRLAWWREALEKLDADPAPAEPLLRALRHHVLPRGVTGAALAAIEDGWTALVDGAPDDAAIARHGHARGFHLFAAAAAILGSDDQRLPAAGEAWALADLGFRHSDAAVRETARRLAVAQGRSIEQGRWPVAARPLAALFVLARRDAHAGARVQGNPKRLLRILALRIAGR